MPRPERSMQQGIPQQAPTQMQSPPAQNMPQPQRIVPQSPMPTASGNVREDIRALNSSLLLITQKIKYLVRNEKILGRNLIVLNKKIKTIEEKVVNPQDTQTQGGASGPEVEALKQQVALLSAQIEDMRSRTATKEELAELKYIINAINPLEFSTLSQVKDMIEKRLGEKKQ